MKFLQQSLLLLSAATIFTACADDEAVTPLEGENYAMFIVTDATDQSGILVPFDEMPTGEINVSQLTNVVQLGSTRSAGISFNGAVYHTSNPAGEPGIQKYVLGADSRFNDAGFLPTQGQYAGGNQFGFINATKGYYSNNNLSQTQLQIFNPETMLRTGAIDFTDQINAIKGELQGVAATSIGGFMIERGGKFFTEVFFTNANGNQVIDRTYVAVVDVATDKLDKIITFDDFKLLGYGMKNTNYVQIDEIGDLYLAGFIGNFNDAEGPNFRVFRIKNNETDFDDSWNINSLQDFNGPNMALGGGILNGKMYVKMFSNNIDISWAGMEEKTYDAYEIDLATKQLTKIEDIPSGYWKSIHGPAIFNGKPYFIVENQEASDEEAEGKKAYYYSYNPATGTSARVITVIGGQPQQIVKF
jgi:hypothetical protein